MHEKHEQGKAWHTQELCVSCLCTFCFSCAVSFTVIYRDAQNTTLYASARPLQPDGSFHTWVVWKVPKTANDLSWDSMYIRIWGVSECFENTCVAEDGTTGRSGGGTRRQHNAAVYIHVVYMVRWVGTHFCCADLFHNLPTHTDLQIFAVAVLLKMGTLGWGCRRVSYFRPVGQRTFFTFIQVPCFFFVFFLHMCVTIQSITTNLWQKQTKYLLNTAEALLFKKERKKLEHEILLYLVSLFCNVKAHHLVFRKYEGRWVSCGHCLLY